MLQQSTLRFLEQLEKNNSREWFELHKQEFLESKRDVIRFSETIYEDVLSRHPHWHKADVKDCLFRINRDVRFSKDKSPYKTHFGVLFAPEGKKGPGIGYYMQIAPNHKGFLACGAWNPDTEMLKKIRQEIAYNSLQWLDIVEGKPFVENFGDLDSGEMLQKIPRGFEEHSQVADYLRKKNFIVSVLIKDEEWTNQNAVTLLKKQFAGMQAFLAFLEQALA